MFRRLRSSERTQGHVGLELGSEGVALCHLLPGSSAGDRKVRVCEYRPCEDAEARTGVLAAAVRDHDLEGACTNVVLPPHQYRLHLLDAPEVQPAELDEAARWLVKDLIDYPLEEAVVDCFALPERRGGKNRVYVVTAREAVVRRVVEVVEASGLELTAIDVSELAARNLMARIPEEAQGLAMLQLGPRSGLLSMCHGGELYLARRLDLGLESIRESEAAQQIDPGALALEDESENDAVDALVLEIQRSLDYYESQVGPSPIPALAVAPLGESSPRLLAQLEKSLPTAVRQLDLGGLLECEQPLPESLQARCLSALGAALRDENRS